MVIEKGKTTGIAKEIPFRNKIRITWTEHNFDEETVGRRLKEVLKPIRKIAFIPEDLVVIIQDVYGKYLAYSKLNSAIRCTILLPDITENINKKR